MKTLWRISNHADLAGLGGERGDGRWHTAARGKRIVYLSEHPALALMETLAQLRGNPVLFPDKFQLLKIAVPSGVAMEAAQDSLLPHWPAEPRQSRAAGDQWLAQRKSVLLAVPSAASPESTNYLFNPLHRDAARIGLDWSRWIKYDKRLFHLSTGDAS